MTSLTTPTLRLSSLVDCWTCLLMAPATALLMASSSWRLTWDLSTELLCLLACKAPNTDCLMAVSTELRIWEEVSSVFCLIVV